MEVREGKLLTAKSNSRHNQPYVQKIDPRWNIGVDKRRSGTLSVLVKLRSSTSTSKTHGLTNNHVVRPHVPDCPADCDKGEKQSKWPLEYRNLRSPSQAMRIMKKFFFFFFGCKALDADTACHSYAHLAATVQVNEARRLDMEKWEGVVD